jgi:hypothetical protein
MEFVAPAHPDWGFAAHLFPWATATLEVRGLAELQESPSHFNVQTFDVAKIYARGAVDPSDLFDSALLSLFDWPGISRGTRAWLRRLPERWREPSRVSGLDEQLAPHRRRRLAVEANEHAHVHLLSLLMERGRIGENPSRLVVIHPQVARGPNVRRSIRFTQSPVGLSSA